MKNAWIRKIILIAILFVIINTGYGFYEESKIKFVENYGDVVKILKY